MMTRPQRHAYMRMARAAQVLSDPDATTREQASARVSFYRGFRALAQAYGDDAQLAKAATMLGAFTGRQMPRGIDGSPDA